MLNEITISHELTHALEDQRFKLDLEDTSGSDDAALANLALVEGSATAVMFTYAERHFSAEQTLGGLLSSLGADTGDLPPFIEAQLIFPYVRGQQFVQRLYETGGGNWSLVNSAYRFRPPASTEQIMHPDKYLQVEQPERVADPRAAPGAGWRRLAAGTWGEWATGELINNPQAAEGWGGDRYELWQRGSGDCTAPCRDRDALVMRWRWDTRADARALRGGAARVVDRADAARGRSAHAAVRSRSPSLRRPTWRSGWSSSATPLTGGERWKPWPMSQPSSRRRSSWASLSIPSATTCTPSARASWRIVVWSARPSSSSTNGLAILSMSIGSVCSVCSDE